MTFAATILTLYLKMFPGPLGVSLAGKALKRGDSMNIAPDGRIVAHVGQRGEALVSKLNLIEIRKQPASLETTAIIRGLIYSRWWPMRKAWMM